MPNSIGRLRVAPRPAPRAGFVGRAGAGIERPAVDREEADALVGVEHVLRAVAVVDVPIDDQHAVEPVLVDRDAGGDGHVVEQAEAHRAVGERMVPGRPHEAERRAVLAGEHAVDRVARRAGREPRDVERGGADHGVGIGPTAAALAQCRRWSRRRPPDGRVRSARARPAATSGRVQRAARPVASRWAVICRSRSARSGCPWRVSWSRNRGSE